MQFEILYAILLFVTNALMREVAAEAAVYTLLLAGNFRGVCSVYKPGGAQVHNNFALFWNCRSFPVSRIK